MCPFFAVNASPWERKVEVSSKKVKKLRKLFLLFFPKLNR